MDSGQQVVEIDRGKELNGEETTDLSNTIYGELKELLDRAVAGSEYKQREALSAMIENGLVEDDSGMVQLDDNLEKLLQKWGDIY